MNLIGRIIVSRTLALVVAVILLSIGAAILGLFGFSHAWLNQFRRKEQFLILFGTGVVTFMALSFILEALLPRLVNRKIGIINSTERRAKAETVATETLGVEIKRQTNFSYNR